MRLDIACNVFFVHLPPEKLYTDQRATVLTDVESDEFGIARGTKHGDPLSTLLFNSFLQSVMEKDVETWKGKVLGIKLSGGKGDCFSGLRCVMRAWSAFAKHRQGRTSQSYVLQHRLHLFDTGVTPTITHGVGTWATTKEHEKMRSAECCDSSSRQKENTKARTWRKKDS